MKSKVNKVLSNNLNFCMFFIYFKRLIRISISNVREGSMLDQDLDI